MGIKELLAKEDLDFVSLRRLLEQIVAADGATLQQAAVHLHRQLNNCCDEYAAACDSPWVTWHPIDGVVDTDADEDRAAWGALYDIGLNGRFKGQPFQGLDQDEPPLARLSRRAVL